MFGVIADSVMPSLLAAASRVSNLTVRSTFGHLVSEHAEAHETGEESFEEESGGMNTHYFFLIIPNLWAILSNLVVIVTIFRTATILRSFAYVMISLSLVDLCSSFFVIPFSIYFFANHMHWGLGYPLCVLWTASDVMFCTASICHHCAIALHRYLIISSPHDFSVTNNHKIIYRLIVPAWCVSAFIASILVVRSTVDSDLIYNYEQGTCGINDRSYAIYSSIVSFFIPLSIIVVVSLRSIFILQKRIDFKRRSHYSTYKRRASQFVLAALTGSGDYHDDENAQQALSGKRSGSAFQRARFNRQASGQGSSYRVRRHYDPDNDHELAPRIIFSSKPRINLLMRAASKRWSGKSEGNTLLKALETFTTKTLVITPTEESAPSSHGLLVGFGPRLPSLQHRHTTATGPSDMNSQSRTTDTPQASHEKVQHSASMSPTLEGRRESQQHQHVAIVSEVFELSAVEEQTSAAFQGEYSITAACERDDGLSQVTEEIVDELSLSHFNSNTLRGQDIDSWPEFGTVMRQSSTSHDLTARSSMIGFSANMSTSTTVPSDLTRMVSLPDIDYSSGSERGSQIIPLKANAVPVLMRRGPLSITEMAALDYQLALSAVAPPVPPTSPPSLYKGTPKLTVPSGAIARRIQYSGQFQPPATPSSTSSNARRAPLAHMNSLEQFDSSSIAVSPMMSTKFNLAIKKSRRPIASALGPAPHGTPRPLKKTPKRKAGSLSLAEPVAAELARREESREDSSHQRRYSEAPFANGNAPIGGPLVPEKFLEMIRKRDHEREVALVKRGRTVAQVQKKRSSIAGQSLNQRFLSFKRALSSRSRSLADKDIAMQTLARRIKKEKQAGHALLVVLMCFVFMWAPFFTLNMAYGVCGECVSKALFTLFSWAGWASCGVNPIIYTLCSRQFRQGLFRSLADAFGRLSSSHMNRGSGSARSFRFSARQA